MDQKKDQKKKRGMRQYLASLVTIILVIVFSLFWNDAQDGDDIRSVQDGQGAIVSEQKDAESPGDQPAADTAGASLSFRNSKLLEEHYRKHGKEMGFATAEEYEAAARKVVGDPDALYKTEAEDGDDVYYLEQTNEFVIVSRDGYIRTYFYPEDGIRYYQRQ